MDKQTWNLLPEQKTPLEYLIMQSSTACPPKFVSLYSLPPLPFQVLPSPFHTCWLFCPSKLALCCQHFIRAIFSQPLHLSSCASQIFGFAPPPPPHSHYSYGNNSFLSLAGTFKKNTHIIQSIISAPSQSKCGSNNFKILNRFALIWAVGKINVQACK